MLLLWVRSSLLAPALQAGHLDFINEIRLLTCIFLGFPSLLEEREGASREDQVACVQFVVGVVLPLVDGTRLRVRAAVHWLAAPGEGPCSRPHTESASLAPAHHVFGIPGLFW